MLNFSLKKGLLPLLAMSVVSFNVHSATQQGTVTATVSDGITFTNHTNLSLGTFLIPTANQSMVFNGTGAASGGTLDYTVQPVKGTDTANGTANANVNVSVSLPNGYLTTGDGVGTTKQLATVIKLYKGGAMLAQSGGTTAATTFDSTGKLALDVGADYIVKNTNISGAYTGTYTVDVTYA